MNFCRAFVYARGEGERTGSGGEKGGAGGGGGGGLRGLEGKDGRVRRYVPTKLSSVSKEWFTPISRFAGCMVMTDLYHIVFLQICRM